MPALLPVPSFSYLNFNKPSPAVTHSCSFSVPHSFPMSSCPPHLAYIPQQIRESFPCIHPQLLRSAFISLYSGKPQLWINPIYLLHSTPVLSNSMPAELNMARENTHHYHCPETILHFPYQWFSIFCIEILMVPAPFVENIIFYLLNCLGTFVNNLLTNYV